MKLIISISFVALFSSGFTQAAPPPPTESEYLLSTGAGFILIERSPVYAMNFEIIKALPEGFHLKFTFENPKKKNYLVIVEIYADETESELIGTHKQKVEFRVPKHLFNAMGITDCQALELVVPWELSYWR